jgi:hypothetical protein
VLAQHTKHLSKDAKKLDRKELQTLLVHGNGNEVSSNLHWQDTTHEIGLQIHQGECPRKEKTHPQFGDLVNIVLNGERISERNDNNKI